MSTQLKVEIYNKTRLSIRGNRELYNEDIKKIGGRWNSRMHGGEGWIIPIENKDKLDILLKKIETEHTLSNTQITSCKDIEEENSMNNDELHEPNKLGLTIYSDTIDKTSNLFLEESDDENQHIEYRVFLQRNDSDFYPDDRNQHFFSHENDSDIIYSLIEQQRKNTDSYIEEQENNDKCLELDDLCMLTPNSEQNVLLPELENVLPIKHSECIVQEKNKPIISYQDNDEVTHIIPEQKHKKKQLQTKQTFLVNENEIVFDKKEKKENEKKENKRKENERKEKERKENERKENERKENERKENEKKENEKKENERKENERNERKEKKENERKENERKEKIKEQIRLLEEEKQKRNHAKTIVTDKKLNKINDKKYEVSDFEHLMEYYRSFSKKPSEFQKTISHSTSSSNNSQSYSSSASQSESSDDFPSPRTPGKKMCDNRNNYDYLFEKVKTLEKKLYEMDNRIYKK